MKKKKMKTLLVASLSTIVLGSSYYNVKADDKTPLEKTLANAAVVDRLSESDEKKVTLITGDVVRVKKIENGKSVIDVDPADQNAAGIQVLTIDEDTYVIPKSAMPYLAANKLDKDLFNVTKLIESGYDDKSLSSLPVIVEYTEPTTGAVQTTRAVQTKKADPKGAKKVRVLESINGAALAESKKEAKTFWKDITPEASQKNKSNTKFDQGIEKIWLDGRVKATLAESVPQIGAPAAWESGFTGKGVKVAVLDTGVDPNHPDLKDQIDEVKSFVPGQTADDADGHGTHVASTVLGTGAASGGKYKGVAPEARLLVGKVLDNNGTGFDSWIIDGMEWAAHKAKIVSMSLGGGASDGTDPLSQAVNRLSEETGALFVIAAGNSGAEGTIGAPGAADAALTIGAVDKADKIAYFSSKGPRVDMGLKPDLSAPGVGIVAAKSGLIPGSGSYMSESGTSMATPHVAGAAAILLQKHPEWNGTQLKEALMSTSKRLDYSPYHIGSGRLDVQAAVFSRVRATGSLSFVFKWPNNNAQPVQKTVTYTNDSDSAVTLNLQADFKDADGKNAPEGMLTVSENQITVPANGTKTVTVTVDPKLADFVRYEGYLTVTDSEGKQVAHTSIGMMKEKERYPLTFKATDRNGNPTSTGIVFIFSEDGQMQWVGGNGNDTEKILLPPGTYSAMSYLEVDDETDHSGVALVGNPEIKLDGPQTVELDARKAKEITVDTPKKAEPSFRLMAYNRPFVDGKPAWAGYLLFPWTDKMYAVPTKKVTTGKFEYSTRWRLIKPSLEINFKGKVLDDIPFDGSTLLDGKYNLSTVYAGKGTPADYERLKANGKAVVVDRNTEVTPSEQAAAAHAAGAKLLIIVNNEDKEFYWYVGNTTDWTDIPLAVAGISKSEGDEVIAAAKSGNLNLFVEGEANPSYLYDLMDVHQDQIPNNLKYAPSNSELVKIDTRYKSDREAPGEEFRYDFRPNRVMGFSSRFLQKLPLPTVRTEWVSVDKDTSWFHKASVLDSSWNVFQPLVTYEKGQRLQEDWFSPVVRPRLSKGYAPRRIENDLVFNIPAWADSGNGSTGYVNNAESVKNQTLKLYQGDTLLQEGKGQILISNKPVPEEKTQYRLVSDAKRDPNRWKTSLSTHTEWTFWSQKGEESLALLPFYSLDYKVDTDMNGNAPAERPAKLELSVAKLEGVAGYGKLEGATLEVSFNEGESWKTVKLNHTADNKWVTKIKNPKNATYVSLRATAWDDLGNKISQDIIKAYGLK